MWQPASERTCLMCFPTGCFWNLWQPQTRFPKKFFLLPTQTSSSIIPLSLLPSGTKDKAVPQQASQITAHHSGDAPFLSRLHISLGSFPVTSSSSTPLLGWIICPLNALFAHLRGSVKQPLIFLQCVIFKESDFILSLQVFRMTHCTPESGGQASQKLED